MYEDDLKASKDRVLAINREGALVQQQLTRDVLAFEISEGKKAEAEAEKLAKEALARAKREAAALLKAKEDFAKAVQALNDKVTNDAREAEVDNLQEQADKAEKDGLLTNAREFRDQIVAIREQQGQEEIDELQKNLERKLALIELEKTMSVEALQSLTEAERNARADKLVDDGDVSLNSDQTAALEALRTQIRFEAEQQRTANQADEVAKRIALDKQEASQGIATLQQYEAFAVASAQNEVGTEEEKQKKILAIKIEYAKKILELLEQSGDIGDATKAAQLRTEIQGLQKDLDGLSKFKLSTALGISDQELEQIGAAFSRVLNIIAQAQIAQIQGQRDANQEYINGLDEKLAATEEAISREAGYQAAGDANDLSREQQKKNDLVRLKESALREDERLARKQARIQKALQVVELVTATAKIISAESSKGVVGIATAAVTIAAMWGAFAAAQSTASSAAASTPSSFYEGTPYVQLGRNKPGRDTVPAMVNKGERIVTTKANEQDWDLYEGLRTGNREQLEKGMAEAARRHGLEQFAEAFAPSGKMPSLDFELPGRIQNDQAKLEAMKAELAYDPALRKLIAEVGANTKGLLDESMGKVDRVVLPDGTIIEYRKNSKRIIKKR